MEAPSPPTPTCATCQKPQDALPKPLKRCAKCSTTLYCSRECQKSDWKSHKRVCASTQQNTAPPPTSARPAAGSHNPGFAAINQLLGLEKNDHLHRLTEAKAFEQLIDCFRLRVEDEAKYGGNLISIYNEEDPWHEFKRFLDLAESRSGILPPWWNAEKRRKCETIAMTPGWSSIESAVEKSDIMEHYSNTQMPMMLRVLGEKIYGKGFL